MRRDRDIANNKKQKLGDEAPEWKDIILVIIVVLLMIAIAWLGWYKFKWLH